MKLTDVLIEAMRSEFGKSKKWYQGSLLANFGILMLSILLVFVLVGNSVIGLGVCLFVLPILSFICREISMVHQDRAENIRRSLMLADAIGLKPSDIEIAQLKVDLGKIDTSEPLFDKSYYDSKLPVGTNRLVDILEESVFFTYNLSKRTASVFMYVICLGLIILFAILYMLLNLGINQKISVMIAKWVALVMVFLVSGDFSFLWRRYSCLSTSTRDILHKNDVLRKEKIVSMEDAMKVTDDYNCAVIQAPPIPGIIYKNMLTFLNEAWRQKKLKR